MHPWSVDLTRGCRKATYILRCTHGLEILVLNYFTSFVLCLGFLRLNTVLVAEATLLRLVLTTKAGIVALCR